MPIILFCLVQLLLGQVHAKTVIYSKDQSFQANTSFSLKNKIMYINSNINVKFLKIETGGELRCIDDDRGSYQIKANGIMISGSGALFECGNSDYPFRGTLSVLLKKGKAMNMGGEAAIVAMDGGILRLLGNNKGSTWTRLQKTATAGATRLKFQTATNWRQGGHHSHYFHKL